MRKYRHQTIKRILSTSNEQTITRMIRAQNQDHYKQVRELLEQYADSLGFDLEFQGFSQELAALPGDYAPPRAVFFWRKVRKNTSVVWHCAL